MLTAPSPLNVGLGLRASICRPTCAAPLVFDASGRQIHRCSPEEALRLQGFTTDQIRLQATRVCGRQALVVNGWSAGYGRWVAACVAATLR